MRKHISVVALIAGLATVLPAPGAGAAQPVEINFIASGPVLGVAPEGYDGDVTQNPLNGQDLKLRYQKRRADGTWATKKTQTEQIDGGLVMAGPTPTFASGKCRIVAGYAGDGTYAPARKSNRYTCSTGMLIYG